MHNGWIIVAYKIHATQNVLKLPRLLPKLQDMFKFGWHSRWVVTEGTSIGSSFIRRIVFYICSIATFSNDCSGSGRAI